jgi:2-C-methyl-D-erythritol 4-phosphate cytidylyltransferase / 2-C-methyl-D-erythritol 2,4-cyclodiphosphate synthase
MFVSAIIAAGGRGTRFGAPTPKQLMAIGGRPILEWAVSAFRDHASVDEIVVSIPPELMSNPPAFLRQGSKRLRVVSGGARRQDSVANAFRATAETTEIVVIHDAARPFVSANLISRTIAAAAESGAALAALRASDTVKRVADRPAEAGHHRDREADRPAEAGHHRDRVTDRPAEAGHHQQDRVSDGHYRDDTRIEVVETLPRESIFLAQTPQAFKCDVLRAALALGVDATDEAALAEQAGYRVRIVEGEVTNIKITTPEDLLLGEAIAGSRAPDAGVRLERRGTGLARTGTGYDLHRLVQGRPLVIGGITVPSNVGATGHSDADVVCHAVTDAILGAACRGDIGQHFPDSDPAWKGASSLDLLARAVRMVREDGLEVGNVDVSVILESPKIRAYIDAMRAAVAGALGVAPGLVSIKAKTNEGLDAIGRGEAIAAHAIAVLRSIS